MVRVISAENSDGDPEFDLDLMPQVALGSWRRGLTISSIRVGGDVAPQIYGCLVGWLLVESQSGSVLMALCC